jgi:hypothetical protein
MKDKNGAGSFIEKRWDEVVKHGKINGNTYM